MEDHLADVITHAKFQDDIFLGVTILHWVRFPIFLLIFAWALQLCSKNPFTGFFLYTNRRKRDITKSHREVKFHLFAANSPLNKIQLKLASE